MRSAPSVRRIGRAPATGNTVTGCGYGASWGSAELGLVDQRVLHRRRRPCTAGLPKPTGSPEPRRGRVELLPQGAGAGRVVVLVGEVGLQDEVAGAHDAEERRHRAGVEGAVLDVVVEGVEQVGRSRRAVGDEAAVDLGAAS